MARNKESKTNIWLPLFLMIGCIVGLILAVSMNDYAYLAGGVAGGLLLGILSIPCGIIVAIFGIILSVMGLIFNSHNKQEFQTTVGLVFSFIGLATSTANLILGILLATK